jgi:hypothetical protein
MSIDRKDSKLLSALNNGRAAALLVSSHFDPI